MRKVFIGMPSGKTISWDFNNHFIAMLKQTNAAGIATKYLPYSKHSISVARNYLMSIARKQGFRYIYMLDTDQQCRPDTIVRLLELLEETGATVACGWYMTKDPIDEEGHYGAIHSYRKLDTHEKPHPLTGEPCLIPYARLEEPVSCTERHETWLMAGGNALIDMKQLPSHIMYSHDDFGSDDMHFSYKCQINDIPMWCDTEMCNGHNGLWPMVYVNHMKDKYKNQLLEAKNEEPIQT